MTWSDHNPPTEGWVHALDLMPMISIRRGGIRFRSRPKPSERDRYLARINRSRCPRSARWRQGTKHTDRGTAPSDGLTMDRRLETHLMRTLGWKVRRPYQEAPLDLSACVSVFDGGTNHQVPSGRRRADSKAYRKRVTGAAT